MKKTFLSRSSTLFFGAAVLPCFIKAQDSTGVAVGTDTAWYSQPMVWTAGGIISILFILALVRWSTNKKSVQESHR